MILIVALTCDFCADEGDRQAKPQAQCRATIEALAEIKNPRLVAFVKITNGRLYPVASGIDAQASINVPSTEK
jgi:hypothetical protein